MKQKDIDKLKEILKDKSLFCSIDEQGFSVASKPFIMVIIRKVNKNSVTYIGIAAESIMFDTEDLYSDRLYFNEISYPSSIVGDCGYDELTTFTFNSKGKVIVGSMKNPGYIDLKSTNGCIIVDPYFNDYNASIPIKDYLDYKFSKK